MPLLLKNVLKTKIESIHKIYAASHRLADLFKHLDGFMLEYKLSSDVYRMLLEHIITGKSSDEKLTTNLVESILAHGSQAEIDNNEEQLPTSTSTAVNFHEILRTAGEYMDEQYEKDGGKSLGNYKMPKSIEDGMDKIYKQIYDDSQYKNLKPSYLGPKNKSKETDFFEKVIIKSMLEDMKNHGDNDYVPKIIYSIEDNQLYFGINDFKVNVNDFLQKVNFNHLDLVPSVINELVDHIKLFIPHIGGINYPLDQLRNIIVKKDPNNLNGLIKHHNSGEIDTDNSIIEGISGLRLYTDGNSLSMNAVLRNLNTVNEYNPSQTLYSLDMIDMANPAIALTAVLGWVLSQTPVSQSRTKQNASSEIFMNGNLDYIDHKYVTRCEKYNTQDSLNKRITDLKKHCENNDVLISNTPLSTSVGGWIPDFNGVRNTILFIIEGARGACLNNISVHASEREVLLAQHSELKFEGYKQFDNGNYIFIARIVNEANDIVNEIGVIAD